MRRALRVYIVEDSAHVQDSLIVLLHVPDEIEIVGFADNEFEAVDAIQADPVDAVIVDLNLREGSGMTVIARLRAATDKPQPCIIVFSNQPLADVGKRAMQLGANHFLDKSSEYDKLRRVLQKLRGR